MTFVGILAGLFVAEYFLHIIGLAGVIRYLETAAIVLVAIFVFRGFKL